MPKTSRAKRSVNAASRVTLSINGKSVDVTNLNKVFYPKTGFTKGEMIDYYLRVAPVLLPHLKNRPLSLKRYPNGVEGFFFYEKRCPEPHPNWVKTLRVEKKDGGEIPYCAINNLPTLVWAANLANLELHPFLHRGPALQRPTALAFDLDPGPPADILDCCRIGLRVKAIFDELGLESFAKTSGSKGLQVYVPLNTTITYERTKAFARGVAELLEKQFPDEVLSKMQRKLRAGKVFVDWSQNDDKKTTVNAYSLRSKDHPTVSTPLKWDEIKRAVKAKQKLSFETTDVLKRIAKFGDLFEPVLTLKQKLPGIKILT